MQVLSLKGSPGRRCLFISYTGLLWIVLQTSVSKGLLQDQYVGCFYDISQPNSDLSYDNALTIESCIAKCPTTYATIQNGNACRCREDYGLQLPDTSCNLTCSGNNNELCGGLIDHQIVYVVYTACPVGTYDSTCGQKCHCKRDAPCDRTTGKCPDGCYRNWSGSACSTVDWQYVGCYKDDKNNRAMEETGYDNNKNTTIEDCFRLCAEMNYSYAGLEWSIQCFCGDTYDRYGSLNETSCNWNCSGNTNEICGGPDALSVYAICPVGNYGRSCSGRCNCLNGERCIFRNGSCPTSRCRPGWTGISCSIRDCSQNNGECYISEICSNVALKFSSISTCRCLDGFQRDKTWENCTDVDECQQSADVCDQSSTTCSNTPGNYSCVCKDGFISFNTISCSGKANSPTVTGEDVNSKTIVAAVVGFIIGIVLTVGIGVTVLIVYRRRNRLTIPHQDNELKTTASTNEVKAFSSQVHDNGRTVASISKSGVETISQKQQLPDGGDRYESLKDIDNAGTIYTTLQ